MSLHSKACFLSNATATMLAYKSSPYSSIWYHISFSTTTHSIWFAAWLLYMTESYSEHFMRISDSGQQSFWCYYLLGICWMMTCSNWTWHTRFTLIDSKGMAFDEKIPSIFNFYWIVCKGVVLAVLCLWCWAANYMWLSSSSELLNFLLNNVCVWDYNYGNLVVILCL